MSRQVFLVRVAAAVAAGLALLAFAWITVAALRLERVEWQSRQQVAQEENLRLGLWRLDATLASLIAGENARSAEDFLRSDDGPAATSSGSRFAALTSAGVETRFELHQWEGTEGGGGWQDWTWQDWTSQDWISQDSAPPRSETALASGVMAALESKAPEIAASLGSPLSSPRVGDGYRDLEQIKEGDYGARTSNFLQQQLVVLPPDPIRSSVAVESIFEAQWVENELLLLRRVRLESGDGLQGVWLDWEKLQIALQEVVADLLPDLRLVSLKDPNEVEHRLALLPVKLLVPPVEADSVPRWTPVKWGLLLGWLAFLVSLAAGLGLIVEAQRLARRRGDFVSAVTHELRTPLTTFELYTEMLQDDMVAPEDRQSYLETLRTEAARLRHLVANVLAFSRLERRPGDEGIGTLSVEALLTEHGSVLERRAAEVELEWVVKDETGGGGWNARGGADAVLRILLNLVDNACKYASGGEISELHLVVSKKGPWLYLRLRDFGPGISRREARKIFRPFHRSASDAAGGPPGVGLGLAISRRLARSLGGDLVELVPRKGPGAILELKLRLADR